MFELRDLEQFMALVEHRNFGRAAAALKMTQPQLSRRIGALERGLGVTLFSREHRQIELTREGEVLLGEARGLLAQVALAERSLRDAASGSTGNLRFGTRGTSQFALVPAAIRRLRELHPQASVTLIGPLQGLLIEHLRRGTIDVTVVRGPVDLEGGLQTALLRSGPLAVGMHESHRLAGRSVVDAAELADEAFVELAWYQAFGYRELTRGYCARVGFVPRVVQVVETSDLLAMAIAAGLGIGLMPDTSGELVIPGLVFRALRPTPPAVDLHAVWRGADRNPLIPAFVRCLMDEARSGGEAAAGGPAPGDQPEESRPP